VLPERAKVMTPKFLRKEAPRFRGMAGTADLEASKTGRYLIRTFSSGLKVGVRAFIGEKSVAFAEANQWTKLLPRLETFLTTLTVANALPGKTGFPRPFCNLFK
jgi:hypothetical protein